MSHRTLLIRTLCQCLLAGSLCAWGSSVALDRYLSGAGASILVRERMSGIILTHVTPWAMGGAIAGILGVALIPFKSETDADIAYRFAQQQIRRRDLSPAEADRWVEFASMTETHPRDL